MFLICPHISKALETYNRTQQLLSQGMNYLGPVPPSDLTKSRKQWRTEPNVDSKDGGYQYVLPSYSRRIAPD